MTRSPATTLNRLFFDLVNETPDKIALWHRVLRPQSGHENKWNSVTFSQFYSDVKQLSLQLLKRKLGKADPIAMLSRPRYDAFSLEMASFAVGAPIVEIHPFESKADTAFKLRHSRARAWIVENERTLERLESIVRKDASLTNFVELIIVLDAIPDRPLAFDESIEVISKVNFRDGPLVSIRPTDFEKALLNAKPEDVAMLSYTSGTSGSPKCAILNHSHLLSGAEDFAEATCSGSNPSKQVWFCLAPLALSATHSQIFAPLSRGISVAFDPNWNPYIDSIGELRATTICVDVVFIEKVFQTALEKFDNGVLEKFNETSNIDPSEFKKVFSPMRKRLGPSVRQVFVTGGPVDPKIRELFRYAEIELVEAYSLNEAGGVLALSTSESREKNATGKILPEVSVRVSDRGEIQVLSRKIFEKYFFWDEAPASPFEGQWFKTGDIGRVDSDGFLYIEERKEETFLSEKRTRLSRTKAERLARKHRLIVDLVTFPLQGEPGLVALITLNREQLIKFATSEKIMFSNLDKLTQNRQIKSTIKSILDQVNSQLSADEQVKRFMILPEELSVEQGELTALGRVRRDIVSSKYQRELKSLMSPPVP